jgi:light-regulated signal transduction histidine kinase (bacteriophytochrome)
MRRLRIENKELESRIGKRTAELEAANKELEAFSYSVSHDLRAPLRHINGYAQALSDDSSTTFSEPARRFVAAISRSAARMSTLIDDLLAFSRMGREKMHQTQFSMGDLAHEVIGEMASDTHGRNIEWDIQPLPAVGGDRAMLKQVWVNLLSNSVKYTRPRDPAKIKVCCAEKDGEWEFQVQDNGVGFDMRYVDKLFGVFQRLHNAEEFEGTGVGLANVRRTILRHGGRTWAEGKINEGTTFYFTLPIRK